MSDKTTAAVDYWVRQARAAIRTAQQANCTHGIPANVCNDCRAETTATETTEETNHGR